MQCHHETDFWYKCPDEFIEIETPRGCLRIMCRDTHWDQDQNPKTQYPRYARPVKSLPELRRKVRSFMIQAARSIIRRNGHIFSEGEYSLPEEVRCILRKIRTRHLRVPAKKIKKCSVASWSIAMIYKNRGISTVPSQYSYLLSLKDCGERIGHPGFGYLPKCIDTFLHLHVTNYFSVQRNTLPNPQTFWIAVCRNPYIDSWYPL